MLRHRGMKLKPLWNNPDDTSIASSKMNTLQRRLKPTMPPSVPPSAPRGSTAAA